MILEQADCQTLFFEVSAKEALFKSLQVTSDSMSKQEKMISMISLGKISEMTPITASGLKCSIESSEKNVSLYLSEELTNMIALIYSFYKE